MKLQNSMLFLQQNQPSKSAAYGKSEEKARENTRWCRRRMQMYACEIRCVHRLIQIKADSIICQLIQNMFMLFSLFLSRCVYVNRFCRPHGFQFQLKHKLHSIDLFCPIHTSLRPSFYLDYFPCRCQIKRTLFQDDFYFQLRAIFSGFLARVFQLKSSEARHKIDYLRWNLVVKLEKISWSQVVRTRASALLPMMNMTLIIFLANAFDTVG